MVILVDNGRIIKLDRYSKRGLVRILHKFYLRNFILFDREACKMFLKKKRLTKRQKEIKTLIDVMKKEAEVEKEEKEKNKLKKEMEKQERLRLKEEKKRIREEKKLNKKK